MSDTKEQQVAIAERLQLKWLKRMEHMLDEGEITSTDMATLFRFLNDNGWTVDPSRIPKGLKEKLTSSVHFDDSEDDEEFGQLKAVS